MRWGVPVWLLCAAISAAQSNPAQTRGVVLERDTDTASGEFSIRLETYEVVRYRFDAATHVDRDDYAIAVPALRPGEDVEVLSDAVPDSLLRHARTVRVIVPAIQHANRVHRRPGTPETQELFASSDPLFARGDMSVSGVVARVNSARLVLHTQQGDRTILLRDDTRYLDNGALATAAALRPNMHVFVRAGRNLYDEVEGYQVVWGSILEPK
jgi:hypothetical protein